MIYFLLSLYKYKGLRVISNFLLKIFFCIDIPIDVNIGDNLILPHNSTGTVIHPKTIIGNNCIIYQGVTIGRGNIWRKNPSNDFNGFILEDNVILCAGCKVISSHGTLIVGKNSVIGANAVITHSIPPNSICVGVPAKIKKRNL